MPSVAKGFGMYITNILKYKVTEKLSNEAFQEIWIEIPYSNKPNLICEVLYRQHNSPQSFLDYLDLTLKKFSVSDKPIYIMGDFNIDLLKSKTCNYAKNFLFSFQSYSFIPSIDKPTRVYNNMATLIDNILINKIEDTIWSGNIVSDISDHYSQFCIVTLPKI